MSSKPAPPWLVGLTTCLTGSRLALAVTLLATWAVLAALAGVVATLTREQRELRHQLHQILLATSALGVPPSAAGAGAAPDGFGVGTLPSGEDADDVAAMLGTAPAGGAGIVFGGGGGDASNLPLAPADDSAQALWQAQRQQQDPAAGPLAAAAADGLIVRSDEGDDRFLPPRPKRGPLPGGLNVGDSVRASRDIRVRGQVRVARGDKGIVVQAAPRDAKRRLLVKFSTGPDEMQQTVYINVFPHEIRPGYVM